MLLRLALEPRGALGVFAKWGARIIVAMGVGYLVFWVVVGMIRF